MTLYRCVIQIEGSRETSWHTLRNVTEDSNDPAALARRHLARVAANRRHTLTLHDLRASVFNADRPGFEHLVLRGYGDDDLDTMAAVAIAQKITGLVTMHVLTIAGAFADYLEGTSDLQDPADPDAVMLRDLWNAAAHRKVSRSRRIVLAVPTVQLDMIDFHAEILLNIASGGDVSRSETQAARSVRSQIRKIKEEARIAAAREAHYFTCGCLRNDAGAHRVGCPDHPEGIPGNR